MLVLVADDDLETCTILTAALKKAGHTTVVARDAMQAVQMAGQRNPDVIVLDIMMPAGTGIGALEKLKMSSRTSHIPVIVVSGITDGAQIERVRQLGAAEFLGKPVDPDAVLAAVQGVAAQD